MSFNTGVLTSKRWLKTMGRFTLLLAIGWTFILAGSLIWGLYEQQGVIQNNALIMGRTAFQKDVLYRSWNSGHGGVYVPITPATPPNPYLNDFPGQNIQLTNGLVYTLINPAYMTRQVFELQAGYTDILGHITSLKPIRPENGADVWEIGALQSFELGVKEYYSQEIWNGQPYLRYMSPLMVEERCMKCHASQGYQVGMVRGGISESVPLTPLLASLQSVRLALVIAHLGVWLVGILGIFWGSFRLRNSLRQQADSEEKLLFMSTHDALTGLHNRAYFEQTLAQINEIQQRPVGVLSADVDGLKQTNDHEGHAAGDQLLMRAADALRACFRDGDVLARTGGDEFVVILPNTTSSQAQVILERVENHLKQLREANPVDALSISVGVASTDVAGSLNQAIQLADQHMYADKLRKKTASAR